MGLKEETNDKGAGRRNFIRVGLGFMGGIGVLSAVGGIKKVISSPKVKMMTADGKLVEIDASHIEKVVTPKASNEELQQWMTKKSN